MPTRADLSPAQKARRKLHVLMRRSGGVWLTLCGKPQSALLLTTIHEEEVTCAICREVIALRTEQQQAQQRA